MENGKIILKDIPFNVDLYSIVKTCAAEEDDELVAEIAEFAEKAEKLATREVPAQMEKAKHENRVRLEKFSHPGDSFHSFLPAK